jgi:hypothetical protein
MAIASHASRQMLEHYSHVRLDLKRKAVEALATRRAKPEGKLAGYATNDDTIHRSEERDYELSYGEDWSALGDDFRTFVSRPDSF